MSLDMFDMLKQMLVLVCWLLPMNTVVICLSLRIVLMTTRITIALIVRIKSFIPTMGA